MTMTILGDFADPLSFLASQRVDQITSLGLAAVRWLAVESDPGRPMTGHPIDEATAQVLDELRLPGERVPGADTHAPNSTAATATYAESLVANANVPDLPTVIRRALFDATWVARRRVDDPETIRSIVLAALHPAPPVDIRRRISENQLLVPLGDTSIISETRRLGFLVSMGRGPMSDEAARYIADWRKVWEGHGKPRLPVVITPAGETRSGERALRWLAGFLPGGSRQAEPDRLRRTVTVGGTSTAA